MSHPLQPPIRPGRCPPDAPKLRFHRGNRFPKAIAWFGARSFWGHLWHLAASVIATEDIDSRDWMAPDDAAELTHRVAAELGGDPHADSLTEAMGEDLWLDFVADTGDCATVSQQVAKILFAEYDVDVPGEGTVHLPRGRMLVFGGDTAYPVATELEIHNRVIVPWNRVLRKLLDGKHRVLLGVPGNHDWYAGLDGFGRMFRRRRGSVDRASRVLADHEIDKHGQIGHFVQWVEAFRVGKFVGKRPTLPLEGYTPVQGASYWALRLAPGLDLFGPDRQLRAVDFQQQTFFAEARGGEHQRGVVLVTADPAWAFLEPSAAGQDILKNLDLSLKDDGLLLLTGDTHHYCRQGFGDGMHVTAGGGGAFLHPARIDRRGLTPPDAEFPGPRASLALASRIPFQIANGGAGFLVHVGIGLLYLPTFGVDLVSGGASARAAWITALVSFILCFLLGGWRRDKALRIGGLAALTGLLLGYLPFGLRAAALFVMPRTGITLGGTLGLTLVFAAAIYASTLVFGAYLAALTVFGLEMHQAFGALAHPGYKHFVRLRVRRDGAAIDGWVLGQVDPLSPRAEVVLVDRFTWHNRRASIAPKGAGETEIR